MMLQTAVVDGTGKRTQEGQIPAYGRRGGEMRRRERDKAKNNKEERRGKEENIVLQALWRSFVATL